MRVALTHAFCWPEVRRGGERLVAEFGRALAAHGVEVSLFTSTFAPGRGLQDDVCEVRFRRWRHDTLAAEADFEVRVLPALALGQFDVVHSHGRRDGVASIHAARSTCGGSPSGCLIPGGVDTERFRPAEKRTPQPTILYSGAIDEPRKGVATFLEALPLIARTEPGVRLPLSGPGDATGLLADAGEEARARTDVLGTGALEDQPDPYGRAWVTALPSLNDTFGLALVESLSCGTPIVASDNAALPELVNPGFTGALCRHGDPATVAAACLEAIGLARGMGTARAHAVSRRSLMTEGRRAARALAVYEEALRTSRS